MPRALTILSLATLTLGLLAAVAARFLFPPSIRLRKS